MTVLRREALVEGFAFSWSSMSSGGTFSLASCADCLLRFINGRRMGKPLRPASSSSAVLKRPKRILQGKVSSCQQSRDATKRDRWTGRKDKLESTNQERDNPSHEQQTKGRAMTNSHISPEPASNDTDWSTYSQVEEHGRLAPAGCTVTPHPPPENQNRVAPVHVRANMHATTDELTAGSRGRRVAMRAAWSTVFEGGSRRDWFIWHRRVLAVQAFSPRHHSERVWRVIAAWSHGVTTAGVL
jgi:hypothetical protein